MALLRTEVVCALASPCSSACRRHSIQSSPLSRFTVALSSKLFPVGSKASPSTPSPRAETAVAEAARQAAARRLAKDVQLAANAGPWSSVVPASSSSKEFKAGRLGVLSPDVLKGGGGAAGLYSRLVAAGKLENDDSQEFAMDHLMRVSQALEGKSGTTEAEKGLYLHGSVGAGKTLLMDLFLASLHHCAPHVRSHRAHLHDFLRDIHAELHRAKVLGTDFDDNVRGGSSRSRSLKSAPRHDAADSQDPKDAQRSPFFGVLPSRWWLLGEQDDRGRRRTGKAASLVHTARQGDVTTSIEKLARALAARLDVMCFDEVSITAIQDCVVLAPLLRVICESGVIVVATSNRAPADLYAGGLNRHVHLPPLVDALHNSCQVLDIASATDHRTRKATNDKHSGSGPNVFLWDCTDSAPEGASFLNEWWSSLTADTKESSETPTQLTPTALAYGRSVPCLQSSCNKRCAQFTFSELCEKPLSAADFAVLCSQFETLLVTDVPRLRAGAHSAAQRWIWLLDQCYERHTRLILTSAASGPEDLIDLSSVSYSGAGGGRSLREVALAVDRANSRMREMQTTEFQLECMERRA